MKKIYKIFLILSLLFAFSSTAKIDSLNCAEGSYYATVDTSTGEALQSSLTKIINNGAETKSYSYLWTAYATTDCKPGTNIIWDMYSNYEFVCGGSKQGASYSQEGDGYNREHSIPQSWFGEASPMKTDLFHVYPTDGYVNNRRGNYPFGEVKTATYTSKNGSKLGSSSHSLYSGTVFEPIDEYKGDFARTYFYMATRYSSQVGNWSSGAKSVFKESYPYLTEYAVDLFTKWSHLDPVSTKEINRNEAVYAIQKNRNPFIDHPEYIDIIFENSYSDYEVDQAKVNNVIALINALPSNITLDSEAQVNNANAAYIALHPTERTLVTNYSILNNAIAKIESLKNQSSGGGNQSGGVVTGSKTVDFTTQTGLASSYSSNQTITVDGQKYFMSYGGNFGDIRLGSNSSVSIPSKYGVSGSGSVLEMLYDVENLNSIEFNDCATFSGTSNWEIVFSSDGGKTFQSVAKGTDFSKIQATLSTPQTGRFALVIVGSKARLGLRTMTYTVAELKEESIDISSSYVNSSLTINYNVCDNVYSATSTKLNFKAYLNQDGLNSNAKYYILVTKAENIQGLVSDLKTNDINTLKSMSDGTLVSADFKTDNLTFTYSFEANPSDEYICVLVCEYEGKLYYSHQTQMSVKSACEYYVENDIITDEVELKVIQSILNNI